MNVIRLPIDRESRRQAADAAGEAAAVHVEPPEAPAPPQKRGRAKSATKKGSKSVAKPAAKASVKKTRRKRRVTPEDVLARALSGPSAVPQGRGRKRTLTPVEIIAECLDQPLGDVAKAFGPERHGHAWPPRDALVGEARPPRRRPVEGRESGANRDAAAVRREASVPSEAAAAAAADGGAGARLDLFWQLWEMHRPALRGQALRLMGGHQADADDALSAAMLNGCRAFTAGRTEVRNAKAWLSQLVHNACMDQYRKRRREAAIGDDFEDEREGDPDASPFRAATDRSPEDELLGREVHLEILGELLDLPDSLLQPLLLRVFRDLDYDEIGEILGLSNAAVRKRVQLARQRLREQGIDLGG